MKHRKLRRLGILALVLVLLFNTIGAQASTGAPDVTVKTYEELVTAVQEASNLDTILIGAVIEIPEGATIGDASKSVILKSAKGYLEVKADNSKEVTTQFTNIVFDGAGLSLLAPYLRVETQASFTGCTFKNCGDNTALNISNAEAKFISCTFRDNKGSYGAHICIGSKATAIISNCSFTGGTATNRGGIYLDNSTSTATITDSIITGNTSVIGGGIANWGTLTLSNTLFYGNTTSTGGADLFNVGSCNMDSLEELVDLYHNAGIEPLSWESDYTDVDYGGTCLKLSYEDYIAPTEPETPPNSGDEEKEPSIGDDTEDTEPPSEGGDEKDPTGGNEGGDNEDPSTSTPENPTIPDEGEQTPTEPAQPDSPQEPEDTEPTTPSTPSDAESTGGGDTVDNSNHSTTDNSQTNIDNSQSTSSIDNSSYESNDNSSYREDNSYRDSSSSTVNNYYQQESPIQEPTAAQNGSQPINITVPVEVSASQGKEAPTGSTAAPEGQTATNSPQQNIRIEAEGVDLVYEYTENGVSISIKAPESPTEAVEAMVVNSSSTPTETPQRANKSPNWVEYVSMILLAVLVGLEIKDKVRPHKEG